jgi:hypothetical protein
MKKTTVIILVISLLAVTACLFAACGDKEAVIESYNAIDSKTYAVGDTYSSSDVAVVAKLKDGTTRNITQNLVFDGDDETSLKLDDDGNFTEAGTYYVTVYALEKRDDLKIGVWTIIVNE